jgi:HEAT repeat protein
MLGPVTRSQGRKTTCAAWAAVLAIAVGVRPARGDEPPAADVFFRDPDRDTAKRIDELIIQFTSDSVPTRRRARVEMERLGYWAVDPLLAAARDREPPFRCSAILTLDALGDRRAIVPLREIVVREDGLQYVGAFAALALGRFRDEGAVVPLRTVLSSPKDLDMLRAAAPFALARIRTPQALDLLREQLADNGSTEPVTAARLLSAGFFPDLALASGATRPSDPLATALTSRRRGERQAALLAFLVATARTGAGRDFLVEFAATEQPPQVTAVALVGLSAFPDAEVTDRICRTALGSGPDALREFACDLLVGRADPAALPSLVQIVRTQPSARLRASAVLGLGRLDAPEARDAVVDRLRDRAPIVRAAAAVAAARSASQPLRDDVASRIAARLEGGETDTKVREVFQLARSVLAGDRRDVVWPEIGTDPLFASVLLTPRQRLLAAVNRRVELSLDLGKITNLQTDADVEVAPVAGLTPGAEPRGDTIEGVPGEEGGAPPSRGTGVPSGPTVTMGAQRTAAWTELRDLLDELRRRPYFGPDDLPAPPAARTEPEKRR